MEKQTRQQHAPYPAMRVYTCGAFALERLISARSAEQPAAYESIPRGAWSHRGPALTLLKMLLCTPGRRASKDALIEALWPGEQGEEINTEHTLHAAVSVLRTILRLPNGESLLLHTQGSDGTGYRLAGQEQLWVDIDAFEDLVAQASRAPREEALALWETAYPFTHGPFLPDDLYSDWSQVRRRTREGHRRLCIHRLADLYLSRNRREEAEVVLRTFWAEHPTDEDALCRLMPLLAAQERTEEALLLYGQTKRALQEQERQPSPQTRDLALRLRHATPSGTPAPRSLETHRAPPEHVGGETPTQTASSEVLRQDTQAGISLSGQGEHRAFPGISQALFASTVLHPMLQAYEDVPVLAWEAFYTSSVQRAASTVEHWLLHLAQQITTVPNMSSQFVALRCRFLQLKSVIARDRTDFSTALATINEAIPLAFHLENAGEALHIMRQSLPKEFLRWQSNLCLSEAHVALAGQDIEQSCQVTEEALAIFQATQSRSGLAKVQRLAASLHQAQPSHRRVQDLATRLEGEQQKRLSQETDR